MPNALYNAFSVLNITKKDKEVYIPGLLGAIITGNERVDVPNRIGYVYVRIHGNLSEIVQVYNDKVSPVYGLPVLIIRDDVDTTRYRIYGRDTGQYENWQSSTSYIPIHGNQHSFNPETFGGGDIVWVYDRQFMPLLVYPSGTSGAGMVMIAPDWIWHNSAWRAVGGTGTASLLTYKPGTGSMGSIVLVSLDGIGNPKLTAGSGFLASVTGGSALLQYLPTPPIGDIPLAMIRLVSGTSTLTWDNIYDLRSLICDTGSTGTAGSGAQTWEVQQWTPGALSVAQNLGWCVATQPETLKKVSMFCYSGAATGTPNHTDIRVTIEGSTKHTGTIPATDDYYLYTWMANEPLVSGSYVKLNIQTHVAEEAEDATIIFEIEK